MGRFREAPKSQGTGVRNPAAFTATWNAARGAFMAVERQPDDSVTIFDMKNIHAIILEPSLSRVTGKSKNKRINVVSNYVKNFEHDIYKVKAYTKTAGKTQVEVIAEGLWKDVKNAPIPQHMPPMRYTKCVAVALLQADISVYNPDTGKSSKFKTKKFDEIKLVVLEFKGRAILAKGKDGVMLGSGWVGSLQQFNIPEDNCDGYYMYQTKDVEHPDQNQNRVWLHPSFEFKPSDEVAEEVIENAGELYEKFAAYLKAHWGQDEDYADDSVPEPDDDVTTADYGSPDDDQETDGPTKPANKPMF